MPFVKKNDSKNLQLPTNTSALFIGRTDELAFFTQNILKPIDPTHNIISISGQGGVGKSTLLIRLMNEIRSFNFKDYCLAAMVDERQATPASMMEKFADQLRLTGEFEKALNHYKEALRKLHGEWGTTYEPFLQGLPDIAGAVVEGIPVAGPLLREGAKITASHFLGEHDTSRIRRDAERLHNPIRDLTKAFITDLNRLANAKVTQSSTREKRERRIFLLFDTFEQLAAEASPWLLDHFLEADVSSNVVLVVAGRDPVESSTPNDSKLWLPYCESDTIYWITLNSFTEPETHVYLESRGIMNTAQRDTIWQLSRGLPLYLSLLTSRPQEAIDPTKNVVGNFLRWIPEQERIKRQLALDAALFCKPFNQDDLEALGYIAEHEQLELYHWLTEQPFVRRRSLDGRYLYHEIAQELFSRHLYQLSPRRCQETKRNLINYYQRHLMKIPAENEERTYDIFEWLETVQALVYLLFSLPDETSHIKAIEQILYVYNYSSIQQVREVARTLRDLAQDRPSNQVSASARETAKYLLRYIEGHWSGYDLLVSIDHLLGKVAHEPSFSVELLASIYRRRGKAYAIRRESHMALSDYDRSLELAPNITWTYTFRGNAYRWQGNYQRAIEDFNYAIKLEPKNALAYTYRGIAYSSQRQFQRGIEDCNQALEIDPKYGWAYLCKSMIYRKLGECHRAIEDCNHALNLDPEHVSRAYLHRGISYRELRDYQQALQDFNQAIEQDPYFHLNYFHRGITYTELKNYQQALQDFNQAIEFAPGFASAYSQRAFIHLRGNNTPQAITDYTRSYELEKKNVNGGLMAQWSRMCQERANLQITECLEEIAATNPEHYISHICRGIALWLRGNYELSLAELEQAETMQSRSWSAYFWKGMAYASLEKDEEAMAVLEMALALELPPVLLMPLHWFEQNRSGFYKKYAEPLLELYEI
jgi:tetratricopeptide (TPR) repeat protein